jgi:Reverse transcriptase (RNA-dependent DNA polymerase)
VCVKTIFYIKMFFNLDFFFVFISFVAFWPCEILSFEGSDLLAFITGYNVCAQVSANSVLPDVLGATLLQVLEIAGLLDPYKNFLVLLSQAEDLFVKGNNRAAFNILYQIWMGPHFVPALLLAECFYARQLIFPNWYGFDTMHIQQMQKRAGGFRPIIITDKRTRICMGVINSLLQASCKSWSLKTTGFRPGFGTHSAINLLANSARSIMQSNGRVYIVMFDIQKAFNSVNMQHLCRTLHLSCLPRDVKTLLWKWHHNPLPEFRFDGLAQGFSYSPTLFAWYLDEMVVKYSPFFVYADNFAGVFASLNEVDLNIAKVNFLLNSTGLNVNQKSFSVLTYQPKERSVHIPWLGHALSMPDCNVVLNIFQQRSPVVEPVFMSLDMWRSMLRSTNWVRFVYQHDWRCIKMYSA